MLTRQLYSVLFTCFILISIGYGGVLAQDTNATEEATAETTAALDFPAPYQRLYLEIGADDRLTLDPPAAGTSSHGEFYLYGGETVAEWAFTVRDADLPLADQYSYNVVLGSFGTTRVTVELILVHGGDSIVLGKEELRVTSAEYEAFRGEFDAAPIELEQGDRIILRLTATGSDFGYWTSAGSPTYVGVFEFPLDEAVAEQRNHALTWIAENTVGGQDSDLFINFMERLDIAITRDLNANWQIGWGLTNSELPYQVFWIDNSFSVEELTMSQAQELGIESHDVNSELTEKDETPAETPTPTS